MLAPAYRPATRYTSTQPTNFPTPAMLDRLRYNKRDSIEPGEVAQAMKAIIESQFLNACHAILYDLANRGKAEGLLTQSEVDELITLGKRHEKRGSSWIVRLSRKNPF